MQTTFESLNETGKKFAGFVFVCAILWTVFIASLVFSIFKTFIDKGEEKQVQAQNWVKPIKAQEEKPKAKSFWSLTLKFEEGGSDE